MSYVGRWLSRLVAALAGAVDGPPPYDPEQAHLYGMSDELPQGKPKAGRPDAASRLAPPAPREPEGDPDRKG